MFYALLFALVALLEVWLTATLAREFGVGATCGLFAVSTGIGLALYALGRRKDRSRFHQLTQLHQEFKKQHGKNYKRAMSNNRECRQLNGELFCRMLSITLLLVPGLLTDVLAFFFLIPASTRHFGGVFYRINAPEVKDAVHSEPQEHPRSSVKRRRRRWSK